LCTILVVIVVKIIFIRSFLFYCLLYNHRFKTNPNTVTNLSKLFNYIAPASLFDTFLGGGFDVESESESEEEDDVAGVTIDVDSLRDVKG
jgi:hypothetical protein